MQDVVALDLRRAVARDQRERIQRHRRGADIGDVVLDREEIVLVDRDGAAEGEAVAIVVFQRHRAVAARGCRSLPAATACSGRAACAVEPEAGDPAEFRVIGRRPCPTARTARSPAISGSTVSRNCTSARSSMRAPFSVMLPVSFGVSILMRGRGGECGVAGHRQRRLRPLRCGRRGGRWRGLVPGCGGAAGGARCCARLRRGFCELGLLLRGALLFHLRDVEEILPADQHEAGQNDGEDGVAVIGHHSGLVVQIGLRQALGLRRVFLTRTVLGRRSRRCSAERRSSSMVAKSRFKAARRPTST